MKKTSLLLVLIMISSNINAQSFVSTTPENRNVILEEFTGINCPACPGGHNQSQNLYDNNPGDVFVINVHTGGLAQPGLGEPDYTIDPTGSDLCWASVPGAGSIGYPAGTINRHEFIFTSAPSPQQGLGTYAYSQGDWPVLVTQILSDPSPVNVGIQANADANNDLVVDIEIYYTGSQNVNSNFLHVAVIQNDIIENPMVQAGGSGNGLWYDASAGTYTQKHVLRHMMTGTWGEELNVISAGTFIQKQYIWQLPADINGINLDPTKLAIVAFLSENSKEIISGNEKKVSSAGWIAPSWDCTGGACLDPGNGNGFYGTEQQCLDNCNITPTWNCNYSGPNQGKCIDPGNGTGNYADSISCEQTCIKRSYNCTGNGISCVDPGDESGTFPTLVGCQVVCGVSESWQCNNDGYCEDPGDGNGMYTTENECISQSGCLPATSIKNIDYINVSIFPNPVSNSLTINGEYSEVNIFDLYGKNVLSSTPKEKIDISKLSKGIYLVKINNNTAISINKIIINH